MARVIRGERQFEQSTALVVCQRGNVPSRSRRIRIIVVHQWNILAIEGCFRNSQTAVAQFRSPASLDRPTTWAGLGRMNQSGTLCRAVSVRQMLAWVSQRFLILACDEWIPGHPVDCSKMSPVSTVWAPDAPERQDKWCNRNCLCTARWMERGCQRLSAHGSALEVNPGRCSFSLLRRPPNQPFHSVTAGRQSVPGRSANPAVADPPWPDLPRTTARWRQ